MNIELPLGPGDKVWVISEDGPRQLTIGQVHVILTDTPGMDLEDGIPWDNYKASKSLVFEFMCVETGIGSGSVYTYGKHAFSNKVECEQRCNLVYAEAAACKPRGTTKRNEAAA